WNISGVSTFALSDRDGHRGILHTGVLLCPTASIGKQNVSIRLCRAVLDSLGYITQVDGMSSVKSDHHLIQIFETGKESARFDLELAIVASETPGLAAKVGVL